MAPAKGPKGRQSMQAGGSSPRSAKLRRPPINANRPGAGAWHELITGLEKYADDYTRDGSPVVLHELVAHLRRTRLRGVLDDATPGAAILDVAASLVWAIANDRGELRRLQRFARSILKQNAPDELNANRAQILRRSDFGVHLIDKARTFARAVADGRAFDLREDADGLARDLIAANTRIGVLPETDVNILAEKVQKYAPLGRVDPKDLVSVATSILKAAGVEGRRATSIVCGARNAKAYRVRKRRSARDL